MNIRSYTGGDADGVWAVLEPIIRAGAVFAAPADCSRQQALTEWCGGDRRTYVASEEGIVGAYYIRPNQQGGGAHVANAGYAVRVDARRRGIGRALCMHSLDVAKVAGFRAVQFNFVVATNASAVALWESCGFATVGRIPEAFRPPNGSYADALIMHRALTTKLN